VVTRLSHVIFLLAAMAIAVSQVLILRSTARGMRVDTARQSGGRAFLEWCYAIVPALALAALLVAAWRTMRPATGDAPTPPAAVGR
jgi:heme/copper-type cytochrome/quinol oxidase subunit 2